MSPSPHVAVTSDQSLLADSVGAALAATGMSVSRLPWRSAMQVPSPRAAERVQVAVMLCDLEPIVRLTQAIAVARRHPVPWVLLTSARRGPLWGAMLDAGVVAVRSSATSLERLRAVIDWVAAGEPAMRPDDAAELRRAWRDFDRDRRVAIERMRSLTPRELSVLSLLYIGKGVPQVALRLGVGQATVRGHVRSVLRKLGVSSQLAAVAAYAAAIESTPTRDRAGAS